MTPTMRNSILTRPTVYALDYFTNIGSILAILTKFVIIQFIGYYPATVPCFTYKYKLSQ